jgi:hypothetical protein
MRQTDGSIVCQTICDAMVEWGYWQVENNCSQQTLSQRQILQYEPHTNSPGANLGLWRQKPETRRLN